MEEYENQIEMEETTAGFEPTLYSVYARAGSNNKVEKIFSTCFEQPLESDTLIKSGSGDEFVHVGYYQIYTNDFCHRYCIDNNQFRECTQEEINTEAAELESTKVTVKSDKERITELEEQIANLTESQAELLYQMCLMEDK